MDIHDEDEVTREPFEDQNELYDNEDESGGMQHAEAGGQMLAWQQPRHDHGVKLGDNDDTREKSHQVDLSIEQKVDRDDDELSTADQEDIKFAKSFGIQLTSSKSQVEAYERLMNSDYIIDSESRDQASKFSNREPRIKTSVTSDCIYHRGTFYQKGDIVALCDQDDGQLYFAQLTGFLQDQYCEKSATINWLVPICRTSREHFDPRAYRIGLEDMQLRKLDCMTFVRHCPHDYYLRKVFPTINDKQTTTEVRESNRGARSEKGSYIWTSLDVCRAPVIKKGGVADQI